MKRFMAGLAHVLTILGGIALSAVILIVCISILGRTGATIMHSDIVQSFMPGIAQWTLDAGLGPINGDYELVEALMAFSIFAFIPLCQLSSGHATVDILTNFFPPRVQRILRAIVEIVFAIVLIVIAWKLMDGMFSKRRSGTTTFLIQFPLWWAYAGALIGATASAIVGVYMALLRTAEAATGRIILEDGPEADH